MRTISILLAVLCIYLNVSAQLFGPQQGVKNLSFASDAIAADMDNDGALDIVASSDFNSKIFWYQNNGSVSFGPRFTITSATSGVTKIDVADFDLDGDLDVVSSSIFDDEIAWYENLGAGSFGPQVVLGMVNDSWHVSTGDLNGDGLIDVLASGDGSDEICWFENLGAGSFGPKLTISIGEAISPRQVEAEDMDNDGDLDILCVSLDRDVSIFENLGGATFSSQQVIHSAVGISPESVIAVDLDNDGDKDVICEGFAGHSGMLENLGAGNFAAFSPFGITGSVSPPTAKSAQDFYASDVDLDGDLDILVANNSPQSINWHENLGGGNFSLSKLISTDVANPSSVFAGDLDGDGDEDALVASSLNGIVAWHENLGTPACSNPPAFTSGSFLFTDMLLIWDNVTGANDYQVVVRRMSPAPKKSKYFVTSSTSLNIPNALSPGAIYRWSVRAACASDTTDWALADTVSSPIVRVQSPKAFISPTPSTSRAKIYFGETSESRSIIVFHVNGQAIFEKVANEAVLTLDVSGLSPGYYQVLVSEARRSYSIPLVVER